MRIAPKAATIVLAWVWVACAAPLVFTHVTVIDATGKPAAADRTVIVEGGRIRAIGTKLRIPKGALVVDSKGRYMIPGLWDMHVHFRGGPELIPDNESWLSLFLAYGITGVREMGGDIPDTVFRWRAEAAAGTRISPRILTSGPKVDGPQPIWPGSIAVSDVESARAAVRRLKSMGADFVKIYAVGFPPEVLAALVDEGNRQGLRVGGHLPFETTTVREAIDGGVKFLEHLFYSVLPGCSREEKAITAEYLRVRPAMTTSQVSLKCAESFDEELARELVARIVKNDVWVTPALAVRTQGASSGRVDYSLDPLRRYVFPGIWRSWDPASGRRRPYPADAVAAFDRVRRQEAVLLKMLQAGGAGILAGSDSGASNNFTFPGWTLHRELALLVENGLSPMEALQAATRNAARYRGELDSGGTVEVGKVADLVLLEGNPLEDIRNVGKVDAVVLRGKLLRRADLDGLLEGVAAGVNLPMVRP